MFIPFTVHLRFAIEGQTRLERFRFAQKIAQSFREDIAVQSELTLAEPDGGQSSLVNLYDFSDVKYGTKFRPQFGEQPPMIVLSGFHEVTQNNESPYFNRYQIVGSRLLGGPVSGKLAETVGVPTNTDSLNDLRTLLQTAIDSVNTTWGAHLSVFQIEYQGVLYGDRGQHFPQQG
jgi:hypothetical protein